MVFVITNSCGQLKNNPTDKQAEQMLKDFYTKYITVFATEPPGHEGQKKLESLQRQYCTKALVKKIPELIEQTDSDPYLKAQDSDINLLKTLTITKDLQNENEYIVSYSFDRLVNVDPYKKEKETVVIHLTVVNEDGSYKIDSIN